MREGKPNSEPADGHMQSTDPRPAEDETSDPSGGELHPGDTYLDGPYLVFTEQFHLRRGYCCNSGCRHCPYRAL